MTTAYDALPGPTPASVAAFRTMNAADDLLTALRNLVGCAGLTWLPGYKAELDAAMIAAHAAIAKATGA